MSFGLVLVFEFIVTVLTFILFLVLMAPIWDVNNPGDLLSIGGGGLKLTAGLPGFQISAVSWGNNGTQMGGLPWNRSASAHYLWSYAWVWSRDRTRGGAGDMGRSGRWARSRSWRWQSIEDREDSGEDRMVDQS